MEDVRCNFWRPLCRLGALAEISPLDVLQDSDRCLRLEELLPGIHDDITLDKIASKLSLTDFHVLSSVSRSWRHAIRSRQVYDARVRSETRETLVLISYGCYSYLAEIVLYSIRDTSCYILPTIPSAYSRGIPMYSQCVSLDGKVYVLGGRGLPIDDLHSHTVYVLDLAGQRQWKECASMSVRRSRMRCGVINGKIFVFGNTKDGDHSHRGEVYDPKENTWSTIKAKMLEDFEHEVHAIEALGQELFLYGYTFPDEPNNTVLDEFPEFLVYHPVTDEWGDQKHYGRLEGCPFVAQGSLHSMSSKDVYIYDIEGNSWRQLHTFALAANSRPTFVTEDGIDDNDMMPICVKAVEGEIFVLCHWSRRLDYVFLLHSKGFSGDTMEFQLEKVPVDLFNGADVDPTLCSMSLLQV